MDPFHGPRDREDGHILLDAPIVFDVRGGTTVHSPMVEVSVAGIATRLALDTGSTAHGMDVLRGTALIFGFGSADADRLAHPAILVTG